LLVNLMIILLLLRALVVIMDYFKGIGSQTELICYQNNRTEFCFSSNCVCDNFNTKILEKNDEQYVTIMFSNGLLRVSMSNNCFNSSPLVIYDIYGKVLYKSTLYTDTLCEIDISFLHANSIYLVSVYDGNKSYTKKIITSNHR
jgi:hypothetical protein